MHDAAASGGGTRRLQDVQTGAGGAHGVKGDDPLARGAAPSARGGGSADAREGLDLRLVARGIGASRAEVQAHLAHEGRLRRKLGRKVHVRLAHAAVRHPPGVGAHAQDHVGGRGQRAPRRQEGLRRHRAAGQHQAPLPACAGHGDGIRLPVKVAVGVKEGRGLLAFCVANSHARLIFPPSAVVSSKVAIPIVIPALYATCERNHRGRDAQDLRPAGAGARAHTEVD